MIKLIKKIKMIILKIRIYFYARKAKRLIRIFMNMYNFTNIEAIAALNETAGITKPWRKERQHDGIYIPNPWDVYAESPHADSHCDMPREDWEK